MRRVTSWGPARYGLAILVVGSLVALKKGLDLSLGEGNPFLLLLAGIMLAAWLGGLGPGLVATALAAFLSDYFFLTPGSMLHQNSAQANFQLGLFFGEGLLISWGTAALRQALATQQQADRNKDAFLATLAHELRNHLAPIHYSLQ